VNFAGYTAGAEKAENSQDVEIDFFYERERGVADAMGVGCGAPVRNKAASRK
jgi:hypothetical protein